MDAADDVKMVTTRCSKCQNVVDVTGLDAGDGITCPYCGDEFRITLQFGNFLLERQLGSGGMGTVYLGRDVTLNRTVAVKVLRSELADNENFIKTFLKEAEITASLNHPNIVQIYAFGEQDGFYYLVMEYIDGGTLDDKISTRGQITELEAVEMAVGVARGLEFAQQRGLIHRDIKPGNIVYGAHNTPKVVDFGLSRPQDADDNSSGEIWGTPYYVAPEKLERLPEDFRSDLYSLGASVFHAISGRPPYDAPEPSEVAMKHLTGSVVSLKAFIPDITDITAYSIKKAMARYPEQRHDSYESFISEMEDARRQILDTRDQADKKAILENDRKILEPVLNDNYRNWITYGIIALIVIILGVLWWNPNFMSTMGSEKSELLFPKPSKAPN